MPVFITHVKQEISVLAPVVPQTPISICQAQ